MKTKLHLHLNERLRIILLFLFLISSFNSSAQPNASFTVDKYNICSGTTVHLANTSFGATSYEWFIEGGHYSFARDTLAVLIEGCYDLKEIKLRVHDSISGLLDSASIVVEVFDTCFFHWTGTFINCPGDTINLAVNNEEITTLFSISEPINIISGCPSCPSIQFTLVSQNTIVDRTSTYDGGCSEITTFEYFCVTSNTKIISVETPLIYPNPSTDQLNINLKTSKATQITICDLSGRIVARVNCETEKITLDISSMDSGSYLVFISSASGDYLQKFIKL